MRYDLFLNSCFCHHRIFWCVQGIFSSFRCISKACHKAAVLLSFDVLCHGLLFLVLAPWVWYIESTFAQNIQWHTLLLCQILRHEQELSCSFPLSMEYLFSIKAKNTTFSKVFRLYCRRSVLCSSTTRYFSGQYDQSPHKMYIPGQKFQFFSKSIGNFSWYVI